MPTTDRDGGAAVSTSKRTSTAGSKPEAAMMKAIAVRPGIPNSMYLAQLPKPSVDDVPEGRGVLVKVLRVGVDGTDKEINAAEYGAAPPGYDFLVTGHEGFGRVEAVGPEVTEFVPGDYVVATVRRPGSSIYDRIGTYDMTTDDVYYERGINLRHGFLTEYYVDDPEYIVKIPCELRDVGVLLEPTTVVEKGIAQAYEIQRRLRVWRPRKAAVMGAGTIGLLAAMALRLRGLEVTVFGRTAAPYLNSELIEALGARYESTATLPILEGAKRYGPFDLIFEATGASPVVFESMQALAKNGVLVLSSVTGGDKMITVPADRINLEFVLGNKVMVGTVNANREYFEMGVKDLAHADAQYPGWLKRLLTHPVKGLENWQQLLDTLTNAKGAIKVYCEVAEV
ncbi:MAG TPA: glucose 1-dehydrogenase [Gemmatimonadales bacterium]|jgi:threonine dehydrogenase-like Zn-dependent dehydrogenase|nr:glucose 1-dehydrogenase [Gemmatimonadales bacterium]